MSNCLKNKTINNIVQKDSSNWLLWINLCQIFPLTIVTIIFNFIATRYSPEKLLFLPSLSVISILLIGIVFNFYPRLSIYTYASLNIIVGLFGSICALRALTTIYVTYITDNNQRSSKLIMIEAFIILGNCLSGFVSGYLIKYLSFFIPQLLSIGLVFVAMFISIFLDRAIKHENTYILDMNNFKIAILSIYQSIKVNKTIFVLITIAQFILPIGKFARQKLMLLYYMDSKFEFNPIIGGYLLACYSLTRALGSLFILPLLIKYFKIKEWILCMIMVPFQFGFYLINAFAITTQHLFIATIFLTFQDVYRPVFMSTLSKMFTGQACALVLAFQSVIGTLASNFGGIATNYIYMNTIEAFPGLVYIIIGLTAVIACIIGTIGVYIADNMNDSCEKNSIMNSEQIETINFIN